MVQYKTEAIVLRLRKYRESDALVTILTQSRGKISCVARGIYKPSSSLRGGTQPYSTNAMMLNEGRSSLHTLIQSECLDMHTTIRQSYEAMTLGTYWAELLENFSQEELADEELYVLAKAGFHSLVENACPLMAAVLEIRLIQQQGLRPDLQSCSHCGHKLEQEKYSVFSSQEGGFLCASCSVYDPRGIKLGVAVPQLWQSLENIGIDKIKRVTVPGYQLKELETALRQWIMHHTGRPMHTWQLMRDKL